MAPGGKYLEENETLNRPLYADTLEMVSWNGADWFYESDFMRETVQELREEYGSIITEQDFREYSPMERTLVESYYSGHTLKGMSPPSAGGPVLALALNILDSKGSYS